MKLNITTLVLVLVAALLFMRFGWGLPWTPWRIAGVAIAAPSFVLFVMARIQLGSAFSVQAKVTSLVTTGIYSRIRNPIYVFGFLIVAGFILWANRPWWLLVLAVLLPLQVIRVRKEERVLEEKFGEEYREYKRKTWF